MIRDRFNLNKLITTLAAAGILGSIPASAQTAAWNLGADFSLDSNPNGPWVYNEGPGIPIPTSGPVWASNPCWFVVSHASVPAWCIANNPLPQPDDIPAGAAFMHATSDSPSTHVRTKASVDWVSPIAGKIWIVGGLWLSRDLGRPHIWSIQKNGGILTSARLEDDSVHDSSTPMSFELGSGGRQVLVVDVVPGDVIRLEIDRDRAVTRWGYFVGVDLSIIELWLTACNDGVDNDGDGGVDMADPDCLTPFGRTELGRPVCGLGAEMAFVVPLLAALRRARRGPND